VRAKVFISGILESSIFFVYIELSPSSTELSPPKTPTSLYSQRIKGQIKSHIVVATQF